MSRGAAGHDDLTREGMDDLLNTAPCGFVSFTDDGRITAANATLAEMLGHAEGELTDRPLESLLTIASRIFFQTHLFPLLRLHGRAEEIFVTLRARDGADVPVLVNVARRERDGVVVSDCVLVPLRRRNLYEEQLLQARRAAEEARAEAERANAAKSQFLTMMSHELRTPLNAIGGYTELLALGIRGPVTPEQLEDLARIRKSQRHLLGLIEGVLDYARVERGAVHYELADVVLDEALTTSEALAAPQARAKRIALEYARRDAALVARADAEKLRQIVVNLLSNAVKFTEAGGAITLTGEAGPADGAGDPTVVVRVADTGCGIAVDQRDRVFEPFVQVDASHARSHEGVGLGLAISRDLARGMGGDLTLESEEGKGSVFTLTLPRVARP
ncbi:MAG: ATP-binding protein [Gemmatimonadaceae bacterium]